MKDCGATRGHSGSLPRLESLHHSDGPRSLFAQILFEMGTERHELHRPLCAGQAGQAELCTMRNHSPSSKG